MTKQITISAEQIEMFQNAVHQTFEIIYAIDEGNPKPQTNAKDREWYLGYVRALESACDTLGIQHEEWNPLRGI